MHTVLDNMFRSVSRQVQYKDTAKNVISTLEICGHETSKTQQICVYNFVPVDSKFVYLFLCSLSYFVKKKKKREKRSIKISFPCMNFSHSHNNKLGFWKNAKLWSQARMFSTSGYVLIVCVLVK